MKVKNILLATVVAASTLAGQAYADGEWYVGLDATNLSYELDVAPTETYDLNPLRFKTGYTSASGFGIELQAFGSADDETQSLGSAYKTELGTSLGLFGTLSSNTESDFGFYGSFGFASIDTENVTVLSGNVDSDKVLVTGFGFGTYYKIQDNFKVTLDYTRLTGQASYASFSRDIDVELSGFGLGLSYIF